MKEIKILYRKPVEAEYKEIKVFDNLDDYLKVYNGGKDFVRIGIEKWKKNLCQNQNLRNRKNIEK